MNLNSLYLQEESEYQRLSSLLEAQQGPYQEEQDETYLEIDN
jgi:hypothetical protein